MSTQVLMPALSPTMSEGKLSKWLVKEGDVVKAGDLIAEIETDKAIMEFESSEDGTIIKLLIKEGVENIKVNEPIAVLDTSNLQSLSKDVDKNDRKNIDAIEKKNKNNELSIFLFVFPDFRKLAPRIETKWPRNTHERAMSGLSWPFWAHLGSK